MRSLRLRTVVPLVLATYGLLIGSSGTALAQQTGAEHTEVWATSGLLEGLASGAITILVGGLLVLFAQRYTGRVTDRARRRPGRSFLVGFAALIFLLGFVLFSVVIPVFLIVAIPVLFVFVVVAIFATVLGELAIGRAVADDWGPALLVAVIVAVLTGAVPVIGTFVAFVIGSIGMGAVIDDLVSDGSSTGAASRTSTPHHSRRHYGDEKY